MKTITSILSWLTILVLTLSGGLSANELHDPVDLRPERRTGHPVHPPTKPQPWYPGLDGSGKGQFSGFGNEELAGVASIASPQVPTGAPGLTFSHVQSYGEAEHAHFDDTQHFHYPHGVATDGNYLWIADSDGNRAVKFNASGVYQNLTIGSTGFRETYQDDDISLEWIVDVGVDASGNIWLVDAGAQHVSKFDSSGQYQSTLGSIWDSGSSNDQFWRPMGIAFDASGNIYISDRNNHRVQIFNSAGSYLTTLGSYGSGNFNFDQQEHIAIQGNRLYVADNRNQRVQIFDISNPMSISYLATLGLTGVSGSANNRLDRPRGVAANASYIFVADSNNHRV